MTDVNISKRWTKMLSNSISRNKIPAEYLSISQNARIKDWCITKRLGQKTKVTFSEIDWEIQGITYNKDLLVVMWWSLYTVDMTTREADEVWEVWADDIVHFINYWKYTTILTWISKPYVYDWTTLTLLTTQCPDVNPKIGNTYAWFTFIVWNTDATKNILYISMPITPTNPENAYNRTGTNAEQRTFDTNILWLEGTLNKEFIFTENRVEYIWKDSLQTIWESGTLISTPIGDWGILASQDWIWAAWDKIFYITKDNTINTIWYAQGTIEPSIGILTDEPSFLITKYISNLDADQSNCKCYFDNFWKTIHRFLRTINSPYNDTSLIYDLKNKTRTTDTNKYYNWITFIWNKKYAWSAINCSILEVDVWLNDDKAPIEFRIDDTDAALWSLDEKIFSWRKTSGWLNRQTNLEFNTLVDDNVENLETVSWEDYFETSISEETGWIWDQEIWWTAIWWLESELPEDFIQFDKTLDHWNLYVRGKRIKRSITENSLDSYFYLDYYTITAKPTGNIQLNDKF